jgi:hypothetical protein
MIPDGHRQRIFRNTQGIYEISKAGIYLKFEYLGFYMYLKIVQPMSKNTELQEVRVCVCVCVCVCVYTNTHTQTYTHIH